MDFWDGGFGDTFTEVGYAFSEIAGEWWFWPGLAVSVVLIYLAAKP